MGERVTGTRAAVRPAITGATLVVLAIGLLIVAGIGEGWGLGRTIGIVAAVGAAAFLLGWIFDSREVGRPLRVAAASSVEVESSGRTVGFDLLVIALLAGAGVAYQVLVGGPGLVAGAGLAAVFGAAMLLRAGAFRKWEREQGAVVVAGSDGLPAAQWAGDGEPGTMNSAGIRSTGERDTELEEEAAPPSRTSVEAGVFVVLTAVALLAAWILAGASTTGDLRDLALVGGMFIAVAVLSARWERGDLPTATWAPDQDVSSAQAIADAIFLFLMLLVVVVVLAFIGVPGLGLAVLLAMAARRAGQYVALSRWERSRGVMIVNDPAVQERYIALRR